MKNNVKNNLVALHHGVCTYCHNLLFFPVHASYKSLFRLLPKSSAQDILLFKFPKQEATQTGFVVLS